ncbi:MAG: helix-turn-helix transcriptional regulator [Burkholderiales bacterium]
MSTALALVDALKRALKSRDVTYAQVAKVLDLSEASVKRLFSQQDFTLERIDLICELAGIDFTELTRSMERDKQAISRLSQQQEEEIVSSPKLLLVAILAMNGWSFARIIETYNFTDAELVGLLAGLDKLRIIELQPGNRIKPRIARTFSWIPDGPMQRYFKSQAARDFLDARFDGPNELMLVVNGRLSQASAQQVVTRLKRVATEFSELHNEDNRLSFDDRAGMTLVVAIRPWELSHFSSIRRPTAPKLVQGSQRRARQADSDD